VGETGRFFRTSPSDTSKSGKSRRKVKKMGVDSDVDPKHQQQFIPWKGLKEQYPAKANLLRLLFEEPLHRYVCSTLIKNDLLSKQDLGQALKQFGVDAGTALVRWLTSDGQLSDRPFIELARQDLRLELRRFIDRIISRVDVIAPSKISEYRSWLVASACLAEKECIRALDIHRETYSVRETKSNNPPRFKSEEGIDASAQRNSESTTVADRNEAPISRQGLKPGRRPAKPSAYYRGLYKELKKVGALKSRDRVHLDKKTLGRIEKHLDQVRFRLPKDATWSDSGTWEDALLYEESKVKAYFSKVVKRVGAHTTVSPNSVTNRKA
jgi:hypothetical protein